MFAPFIIASSIVLLGADETSACSARSIKASLHDSKDIVDTAIAAGQFKTLATALQAAKLVDALKGQGPFTVFAPTDDAFAKLPKGTLETLLKPENRDVLTSILTYHVVSGNVMAKQAVKLTHAETLNGQRIDLAVTDKGLTIDGALVVKADIACKNGVIHVIDRVILPSQDDLVETAVKAGSFTTLATAIKAAGLVEALETSKALTVFAPTDEAFMKLPKGTVEALLKPENKERLQQILKFHVVAGRVHADQAIKLGKAETLSGGTLHITSTDHGAQVNGVRILKTDVEATNGVIHVIDEVLLPPSQG
ncbi:MAG: fasciclin domain-containing protein [Planctomycetes bacterium]|nr:fasciclin domain-containing protein [Planctomycetota bacterium]